MNNVTKKRSVKSKSDNKIKYGYPEEIKNLIRERVYAQTYKNIQDIESKLKRLERIPQDGMMDKNLNHEVLYLKQSLETLTKVINNEQYLNNINNIIWNRTKEGYRFWLLLSSFNLSVVSDCYDYDEVNKKLIMRSPNLAEEEEVPGPLNPEIPAWVQ